MSTPHLSSSATQLVMVALIMWISNASTRALQIFKVIINDNTHTHTHTHTQPFYGSVEFVRYNPGEPVTEETFTHSHSSWSSINDNSRVEYNTTTQT